MWDSSILHMVSVTELETVSHDIGSVGLSLKLGTRPELVEGWD